MRPGLSLKDVLLSLIAGIVAALVVVLIMTQFSPAGAPVRATLVNCAAVRARSRQVTGAPESAELRRAQRQCAQNGARAGDATPPAAPVMQAPGSATPHVNAAKDARSHGWRKIAAPLAN